MNNRILYTNIQRFSLNDGPGIRTTVFLKGCSLRCPWCSNPENINPYQETYIKNGIEGVYGRYCNPEEIINECLKDKNFYDGTINYWDIKDPALIESLPGGVTFSGGEPLLQMGNLVPVCIALHDAGVHIAVETCLFVPQESLSIALTHIDFFYVDMKILNAQYAREIEKGDFDLYLINLDILMNSGKPVVIRVPVIGNYTDGGENRKAVHNLVEKYKDTLLKIELIKEHNLAESKYNSLGISMTYQGVSDDLMEQYKNELSDLGILTEICKI